MPEGAARVTIPRGGSIEYAVEFARKNAVWLQRQLQRTPPEWSNGTEIFFRGIPQKLEIIPGAGAARVAVAGLEFEISPGSRARTVIEAHLRSIAAPELVSRTLEMAAQQQLEVGRVQVRDQRSRWGSCSTRKTICLNWRLIQTPEFVRDYIIIHELMHLREMSHSAKFWAHVAAACPGYMDAERWLRKHARLLR
jgi:predicted metal-dependent hydrolase